MGEFGSRPSQRASRSWRGRPLGCQLSESKQQEFATGPVGAVAAAQLYDASHDLIGGKAQRGGDVFGSTQEFMVSGRHEDVLPFGALRWVTPSVKIWPSS